MDNKISARLKSELKVDTFIQGTLILFILTNAGLGWIFDTHMSILAMLALAVLGMQQVGSAILFGLAFKDMKKRGLYLLSVIGFPLSCYGLSLLQPYLDLGAQHWGIYFTMMVVSVLTLHYFTITIRDMIVANSECNLKNQIS